MRTNAFQRDGAGSRRPALAIKFDCAKVDGLPEPRPFREIFVYSPRVEGLHLRFGAIARGGLRWSDRPEDFRTEVLGLVKAQQVKNAIIVPVGAKGAFVPRMMPAGADRETVLKRRHRLLQDLRLRRCSTSPTISTATWWCRRPTCGAATATIPIWWSPPTRAPRPSPTPPTPSRIERGFWLGDAFASGGSNGYDHKKMGITARGAWEAVKRHFREMDRDIQTAPFTVVGVGDMSRRRVRQRHAAVAADPADRRLRPSRHLHRSRSRSGATRWPSASGCSTCRARAGRTTTRT